MTDVLEASAIVLGSSTLNNGMLPRMADFLCTCVACGRPTRWGAAFGSYGWSGEAVKMMNEILKEMNIVVCHEGVKTRVCPGARPIGPVCGTGAYRGQGHAGEDGR